MSHFSPTAAVNYFFNYFLMKGVLVTIGLTVAAVIGGLILGMGIALMRMSFSASSSYGVDLDGFRLCVKCAGHRHSLSGKFLRRLLVAEQIGVLAIV